jgi:hypothetical protein
MPFRDASRTNKIFFHSGVVAAVVALASVAGVACKGAGNQVGGGAPGTQGNGDAAGDAGDWLHGEWTGNYVNKEADAGSTLKETTAHAVFVVDEDSVDSGTFEFTLPMLDDVHVSGTFRDFARKSLMLKINESNLSAVGLSGASTSLDYDMVGDALELSNDRVVFRLLRGGDGDDGDDDDDEDDGDGVPSLLGAWSCDDAHGHTWRVNMRSAEAFSIDVYDSGSTSAGIRMDGGVVAAAGDTLEAGALEVTWCNVADYVGMKLSAERRGNDELRLARLAADSSEETEVMFCARER